DYFWGICQKILRFTREMDEVPEEFEGLERLLADTYFCNFSLFQSIPDSWAVNQLFPIMPIHRLLEEPTHRAVLADITCDSDGKIDEFIDRREVKHVLQLHAPNEADYYLGFFLVGAYQEILGDMHNLFGDTNTVHVQLGPDGDYDVKDVVAGDTVSEVLSYVDYSPSDLLRPLRHNLAGPPPQHRRGRAPQEADHDRGVAAAHQPVPPGDDRLHVPRQGRRALTRLSP